MRVNGFSRTDRQSAQSRMNSATGSRSAANTEWRSSPPTCRSCAVAHPATRLGISGSSRAPNSASSDHSDSRRPPADKSDGAPPSTSLFAITVSAVTVNHAIRRRATGFGEPKCRQVLISRNRASERAASGDRRRAASPQFNRSPFGPHDARNSRCRPRRADTSAYRAAG